MTHNIKLTDGDICLVLDALYGQVLGIELKCQKVADKIVRQLNKERK